MGKHCKRSTKEYQMLEMVHVIVITRSSQHTTWNQGWMDYMRSKIVNTLLLGEAASSRTTMEKWIGNEEGSLIPRGREPLYRIQGHKLQVNDEPTLVNMAV